jgi:chaperonin cofactor prefoldin
MLMSALAIDPYRLLTALKGTGKSANYSAEDIASAMQVAQEGGELLTRAEFGVRMDAFDARMDAFEKRMDALEKRIDAMEIRFDAKLEALRADIKAEVKASQVQNLLWLSGIVLASNGVVIALLARLAHVV